MTDEDIIPVCSKTIKDYVIFYDGMGMYQVYYQNKLIQEFEMEQNPKALHRTYHNDWLCAYPQFKELFADDENLNQILKHIESKTEQAKTHTQQIMDTFRNLFKSLKMAYMDYSETYKNFQKAEPYIKAEFRKLLASIDDMESIFMQNLLDTMSVDEIIEQRRKPDLTEKQRDIISNIQYDIEKEGLLSYLEDILDNIHIGEHKNIYRKVLMLFNVMRGKGSYLSETIVDYCAVQR